MTRISSLVFAGLLLAVTLAPLTHAAPATAPPAFEARLLHDFDDDALLVLAGKHGFDAVALDLRQAHLPTGEPAAIFRLILDGGCNANLPSACPELAHTIQFNANGTPQEIRLVTLDGGANWTTSAGNVTGPLPTGDGTRFAIEAAVSWSSLNATNGTMLDAFFVAGHSGDAAGDDMPAGLVDGQPDDGNFDIGNITLSTPAPFLSIGELSDMDLAAGFTVEVPVQITNLLDVNQTVTLTAAGTWLSEANFTLGPLGNHTVNATVAGGNFNWTITATSELGAYVMASGMVSLPEPVMSGPGDTPIDDGVNSNLLESGDIAPGANWTYVFAHAGQLAFNNSNAPNHTGTITVTDGSNAAANHTVVYNGSWMPATLSIQAGDTVMFQNDGNTTIALVGVFTPQVDDTPAPREPETIKDTPGFGLLAALAAVALAFVVRRRK